MSRFAVLAFIFVLMAGMVPATTIAQDPTADRVPTPAEAARELSELEADGDFDTLYDKMHPDAQAIIPREAVVGWFEDEYAPLGPGVLTVTGVEFVTWTWDVTGATYPDTAEVAFEQPFADGSVVEDVVRLVADDEGKWGWFFGRSRAFVDEQIARYGGSVASPGTACQDADRWWLETVDRQIAHAYVLTSFYAGWSNVSRSAVLIDEYAAVFAKLGDEQEQSEPPPAAAALNETLVERYRLSEQAMTAFASSVRASASAWLGAGSLQVQEGARLLEEADTVAPTIEALLENFEVECAPVEVKVCSTGGEGYTVEPDDGTGCPAVP